MVSSMEESQGTMGTGLTVEMIRMGQKRAPIQTRNLKAFDCISGWYTMYRPIANLGMGVRIEVFTKW